MTNLQPLGPEPKLQFISSAWISEVEFAPEGEQPDGTLNLKNKTTVGKIRVQGRWYKLFLQLAGPIPLVWIESPLTGKPAWLTAKAKQKIDQLLEQKP